MELLKEKGLDDVLVVIGGIIPDVDVPKLKAIGIKGVFLPGTPMQEIVDFINVERARAGCNGMPYTLLLADDSTTIQRMVELTFAVRRHCRRRVQRRRTRDRVTGPQRCRTSSSPTSACPGAAATTSRGYIKNTPPLAHIPVLLLTGAFEPVDQAKALEAGCDGVLIKPFEPQFVISRVKELLRKPKPGSKEDEVEEYFEELDKAFANLATLPAPRRRLNRKRSPIRSLNRQLTSRMAQPSVSVSQRPNRRRRLSSTEARQTLAREQTWPTSRSTNQRPRLPEPATGVPAAAHATIAVSAGANWLTHRSRHVPRWPMRSRRSSPRNDPQTAARIRRPPVLSSPPTGADRRADRARDSPRARADVRRGRSRHGHRHRSGDGGTPGPRRDRAHQKQYQIRSSDARFADGPARTLDPARLHLPEKPALEGLEAKWMRRWEESEVYRFDATRPRERCLFDRHAAADRQRIAPRRSRVFVHPHRSDRALPAHARQGRVLSDGMG